MTERFEKVLEQYLDEVKRGYDEYQRLTAEDARKGGNARVFGNLTAEDARKGGNARVFGNLTKSS